MHFALTLKLAILSKSPHLLLWVILCSFPYVCTHFILPKLRNPVLGCSTLPVLKPLFFLGFNVLQRATLSPMCRGPLHPSWGPKVHARAAPCATVLFTVLGSDVWLRAMTTTGPTVDILLPTLGLWRLLRTRAPSPLPSMLQAPPCLAPPHGIWSELQRINFLKIKVK